MDDLRAVLVYCFSSIVPRRVAQHNCPLRCTALLSACPLHPYFARKHCAAHQTSVNLEVEAVVQTCNFETCIPKNIQVNNQKNTSIQKGSARTGKSPIIMIIGSPEVFGNLMEMKYEANWMCTGSPRFGKIYKIMHCNKWKYRGRAPFCTFICNKVLR